MDIGWGKNPERTNRSKEKSERTEALNGLFIFAPRRKMGEKWHE
jgi:hypothetical protein